MGNSLTSVTQLSRTDIERLVDSANRLAREPRGYQRPERPIVGLIFLQESTRTRVGFETAAFRLGGQAVLVGETKRHGGMSDAETLEDTVRSIQSYCDVICLRHPDDGMIGRISEVIAPPIINCGNGYDEHPTQALIDLMTIKNTVGRLDDLTVAMLGDLRFSRSAHSLVLGLSRFDGINLRAISPPTLRLPDQYREAYLASGQSFCAATDLDLTDVDVVYVAGFAARTPAGDFLPDVRGRYRITREIANGLKPHATILCPLPRIDEIDTEVDRTHAARYFTQSDNGLPVRMAVLSAVLE